MRSRVKLDDMSNPGELRKHRESKGAKDADRLWPKGAAVWLSQFGLRHTDIPDGRCSAGTKSSIRYLSETG